MKGILFGRMSVFFVKILGGTKGGNPSRHFGKAECHFTAGRWA